MRKSRYLRRFVLVLAVSMVFSAIGSIALTWVFSQNSYANTAMRDLRSAHNAGKRIMDLYVKGHYSPEELEMQFNPELNTAGVFWVICSRNGSITYESARASLYLNSPGMRSYISQTALRVQEGPVQTMMLDLELTNDLSCRVMGEVVHDSVLFTGIPVFNYRTDSSALALRMLYTLPVICLIILLLSSFYTRRTAQPAVMIINAANRIREGEEFSLPENMPGEAGEVAQAFNYLTNTVQQTLSELRQEKETMELVFEGLHEGILASDEHGMLLHRNSAALSLLGGEESAAYEQVWQAVLNRKEGIISEKLTLGETVLQYTVTALPGSENSGGSVALIRDITQQERLERTRHDYVANISHELRTPLASIRGLAEGLRDGMVVNEAQKDRYYSIIADESNRLSRLVNDLLELSGLQSNPATFEMEKVDPNELVYDLVDRNMSLFEEKGITLVRELPPEDDLPMIISNEDRLAQVLTIFMDNARKFTPEGGTVTLSASLQGDNVRFAVRDTGVGMDEETRLLAFERFHQAERSHSEKGAGLGLAIAREIMQKLGVTIHLESEKGKGSEFSFEIPLKKDQ